MKNSKSHKKNAEAHSQLRLTQEIIASIFNAAPIGIVIVSTDRQLLEMNQRFCEILGYTREELLGQNARILYPSDDEYQRVGKKIYKIIEQNGCGEIEAIWKHKDGHIMNIYLSSTPVDVNDLSKGITFTATDITESKKAAFALRMSEQRFRNIANYTYDWEMWLSITGTLLWINPAVQRITGYTVEQVLNFKDFPLPIVHYEDREMVELALKLSAKGTDFDNFEFRIYTKDDQLKWISMCTQPIFDQNDAPQGIRVSLRDITQRKKVDLALNNFVKFISAKFGKVFFTSLVTQIAKTVDADVAMVAQIDTSHELMQTLAVYKDDYILENFKYPIKGAVCEEVLEKKRCVYKSKVAEKFPKAPKLKEWKIEAYIGIGLVDSNNFTLGLISVLFRKPVDETHFIEDILRIFASRTAAEIERNTYELAFLKRLNYEDLIFEISEMFTDITPKRLNLSIDSALGELANYTAVDSAYLFQFSDDLKNLSLTHVRKNRSIDTKLEHMKNFNCSDIPWWTSRIMSRQPVLVTDAEQLPKEAYIEKKVLLSQNIKSVIDVPVTFEGKVIGFIGMSSATQRTWNEDDISLLRIIGQLIANALYRMKIAKKD